MSKISPKNLASAIYSATEGKSGSALAQAVKKSAEMLRDKRMLGKGDEVLKSLQQLIDKKEETIRMKIIGAKKLSSTEEKKIEHEVKDRYKARHIVSEFIEDKEMLGGYRVEVGEEVWDSTWRTGLKKLEKALVK